MPLFFSFCLEIFKLYIWPPYIRYTRSIAIESYFNLLSSSLNVWEIETTIPYFSPFVYKNVFLRPLPENMFYIGGIFKMHTNASTYSYIVKFSGYGSPLTTITIIARATNQDTRCKKNELHIIKMCSIIYFRWNIHQQS